MNTTCTRRLLARLPLRNASESIRPSSRAPMLIRYLSSTATRLKDDAKEPEKKGRAAKGPVQMGPGSIITPNNLFDRKEEKQAGSSPQDTARRVAKKQGFTPAMQSLDAIMGGPLARSQDANEGDPTPLSGPLGDDRLQAMRRTSAIEYLEPPYHLHIYSHRHNTHVTLTKPNRDAIISLSCGNLGFKKARRKTYDAAYQLTVYALEKLYAAEWDKKITKLEIVLRGFGAGREAATKVLLGNEGMKLRDKIIRVSDSTRIKFGGTRSKNKRRV